MIRDVEKYWLVRNVAMFVETFGLQKKYASMGIGEPSDFAGDHEEMIKKMLRSLDDDFVVLLRDHDDEDWYLIIQLYELWEHL